MIYPSEWEVEKRYYLPLLSTRILCSHRESKGLIVFWVDEDIVDCSGVIEEYLFRFWRKRGAM